MPDSPDFADPILLVTALATPDRPDFALVPAFTIFDAALANDFGAAFLTDLAAPFTFDPTFVTPDFNVLPIGFMTELICFFISPGINFKAIDVAIPGNIFTSLTGVPGGSNAFNIGVGIAFINFVTRGLAPAIPLDNVACNGPNKPDTLPITAPIPPAFTAANMPCALLTIPFFCVFSAATVAGATAIFSTTGAAPGFGIAGVDAAAAAAAATFGGAAKAGAAAAAATPFGGPAGALRTFVFSGPPVLAFVFSGPPVLLVLLVLAAAPLVGLSFGAAASVPEFPVFVPIFGFLKAPKAFPNVLLKNPGFFSALG